MSKQRRIKLDDVAWCERCLRPFDRPTPAGPNKGWKVCDECICKGKERTRRERRKEVVPSRKRSTV